MKSKVIVGLLTCMMVMAALTCGTACGKETEDVSSNVRVEATKIVSENKDEGTAQGDPRARGPRGAGSLRLRRDPGGEAQRLGRVCDEEGVMWLVASG